MSKIYISGDSLKIRSNDGITLNVEFQPEVKKEIRTDYWADTVNNSSNEDKKLMLFGFLDQFSESVNWRVKFDFSESENQLIAYIGNKTYMVYTTCHEAFDKLVADKIALNF